MVENFNKLITTTSSKALEVQGIGFWLIAIVFVFFSIAIIFWVIGNYSINKLDPKIIEQNNRKNKRLTLGQKKLK